MSTVPLLRFNISEDSPRDVQQTLYRDGAVILTNLSSSSSSSWSEVAAKVPHLIWKNSEHLLLKKHRADAVHVEHAQLKLSGQALLPHTDGYVWGDCYPDLVILVCEQPDTDGGGANFLIDGCNVVKRLKNSTREFLEQTLVDHTERGESSFAQGAESIVPVLRWFGPRGWQTGLDSDVKKRLCWRRMIQKQYAGYNNLETSTTEPPYISLWAAPPRESGNAKQKIDGALYELDQAIAAEERDAVRFRLESGEALIVDNFRMLHARESFQDEIGRRMWRVWSWTNASIGLPPELAVANESNQAIAANLLEAEEAISTRNR